MKQTNYFIFRLLWLLTLAAFITPLSLHADSLINQSNNIFKFQQKLALNGNEQAQYKLASMYETGDGTEKDIDQAKHWFSLSAKAGFKPAIHRAAYLAVKEQGYQAKDAAWLASIEADAGRRDADAVFLLAQLYRAGIGVKKDLDKSLELLSEIKILGLANVEKEMAAVREEKAVLTQLTLQKDEQREQENAKNLQAKKDQQMQQQIQREQLVAQQMHSEAEKKRKYEEVMNRIKQEQMKINRQQAEITGEAIVSIDDEI